MRISGLSRTTGVPVATIKYYLREGLLPPGATTGAANQAEYDDTHVHRLHLIRVLLQVGGLSVAAARRTIAAIDDPDTRQLDVLATAHGALPGGGRHDGDDPEVLRARADVDAYLEGIGWTSAPDAPARGMLADALIALRRLGRDVGPEIFAPYAEVADDLARRELGTIDLSASRQQLVEDVVIGTVVFESALVAFRRLAQANHSAARFGARDPDPA